MAVVKGSHQENLIIRQYRPWERFRRTMYLLIFIVIVGVGGYFGGIYGSTNQIKQLSGERDKLNDALVEANQTINTLTQRVNVLEKGGEVDRKATEGIRQTVKELKAQIATLEEEVAFYKGIMAPSSNDKGLRISKVDILPVQDVEGRFRYSIMMTQVADNSSYISGLAAVNFIGVRNSEKVILPLRDLDSNITDLGVKFRFRYFQEVAGDIVLPAGFVPEQVQVVLQSTGNKAQRVEETIEWP
ncbi:MAG: hypothetical protein CMI08_15190 [Oceanospirillaceae bacterium]|uniref:DUF6776 family protein n=1 Tax=unclassified Thalassolituus TaxID=2624967 RepID=UPI000C53927C|nr:MULTISPECIES: DUF6776 family protein [unclassified Thalassolituus]MAY00514.1 hypothetical protein [Oceanospirillaceae bacterium]MBL35783.1 hypothetical protein [Oceanospirillaceae bacterium]MBS53842.1 hypothetical protein [Oceanospirillaceae bacterium]|tara:strand:- start:6629 stop:7360 length:732 start_codon:yes stop_codon:yes gene_type:complete